MGLAEKDRQSLVVYKLEKAKETIAEIPILIENELWRNAANRLYYACFYAVSALLLKHGHSSHTHGGTKGLFGQYLFLPTSLAESKISCMKGCLIFGKKEITTIGLL